LKIIAGGDFSRPGAVVVAGVQLKAGKIRSVII